MSTLLGGDRAGGTGIFSPNIAPGSMYCRDAEELLDGYSDSQQQTVLKILDTIADGIRSKQIASSHGPNSLELPPLEAKVGFNSFFAYFRDNPAKKNYISVLLNSLGREFPP